MELYVYRVKQVLRVIDGDTIDLLIDLGFNTYRKVRVRLYGIDTPEIFGRITEQERVMGLKAKQFVEYWLEQSNELFVKTIKDKRGKYGRYLARIYNDEGECLNDLLLEQGLAEPREK